MARTNTTETRLGNRETAVTSNHWDWPIVSNHQKHSERVALLRPITYELTAPLDQEAPAPRRGKALSLNISSGGMLLLMEQPPTVEQVVKIKVPTPLALAETPTLAEVRWVRPAPFPTDADVSFVGLKFLF